MSEVIRVHWELAWWLPNLENGYDIVPGIVDNDLNRSTFDPFISELRYDRALA